MRKTSWHKQKGLTLIEVLVAVLVLGTAAASLLTLISQHTRNTDQLRQNILARIAAENIMVATMIDAKEGDHDDEGSLELADRVYDWQVVREPSPLEGFDLVRVEIRDPAQEDRLMALLASLAPKVADQ